MREDYEREARLLEEERERERERERNEEGDNGSAGEIEELIEGRIGRGKEGKWLAREVA